MNNNIHFRTSEISSFYSTHRVNWIDLYESEKKVLQTINFANTRKLLDIGCGCGGLGMILREKFGFTEYTGIEINQEAAEIARKNIGDDRILNGDFLDFNFNNTFDIVVTLSCIDWNIEFDQMLEKAWSLIADDGDLLISLRLTENNSIFSPKDSYQYINFDHKKEGEIAPYIVINVRDWIDRINHIKNVSHIYGYGYFLQPSDTAVTPLEEICFAVFVLKKSSNRKKNFLNLDLPDRIMAEINGV